MRLQETFISNIQAHQQLINKVLYLYTDNLEDRKDLRQEILSQAWLAYPKFRGDAKFSSWLYRIALNVSISGLKQNKKRSVREASLRPANASKLINETELLDLILALLNEIEKSIVLLLVEGYEREEIADMLGISKGDLRVKIFA